MRSIFVIILSCLSFQAVGEVPVTQDLKSMAVHLGAQEDEALGFTNLRQLLALKFGADAKQALKFSALLQVDALQAGASVDEALKFESYVQLRALQAGANPSQALRFSNYSQVEALKVLVNLRDKVSLEDNVEQALKFANSVQVNAFMNGDSLENSLKNEAVTYKKKRSHKSKRYLEQDK